MAMAVAIVFKVPVFARPVLRSLLEPDGSRFPLGVEFELGFQAALLSRAGLAFRLLGPGHFDSPGKHGQ